MMNVTVYTIGHSTHSINDFISLLSQHAVGAVADVRSSPYSRHTPQFNRETLRDTLRAEGISYVFLGEELGARSTDSSCYRHGKVQYDLLAATPLFQRGLDRVVKGASQFRLALMCAERDPLDCHRTILVARRLIERGLTIQHILADGTLETQEKAVERLLRRLQLPPSDLLRSKEETVREAYKKQGAAIAYEESQSADGMATP
jgi:uncharacterized protein (DUF488 family)